MSRPGVRTVTRARLPANVRRRRSGVHGWGIFARDFIAQDTRIIEYVGERITKAEAQRREDRRLERRAAGGDGCVYIFEISLRHDIDGNVRWNPARHINHSCAPNCEAQSDRGRIWIVALRDIAPGEELTYDYGFSFGESRHHPCRCGAKECVGFIVERAQRWRFRRNLVGRVAPDEPGVPHRITGSNLSGLIGHLGTGTAERAEGPRYIRRIRPKESTD